MTTAKATTPEEQLQLLKAVTIRIGQKSKKIHDAQAFAIKNVADFDSGRHEVGSPRRC